MLCSLRTRLTYANVVATLALLFAMTGGALAATHYLITSSKQISPKVLKELKREGPRGATGQTGAGGAQGERGLTGEHGPQGEPGAEGKAGPEGKPGTEGKPGAEGKPSGNAPHWRATIAAPGASEASAATTTLLELAPFKVVGHCFEKEGDTVAATYLATSEAGAVAAESEEGEEVSIAPGKELLLSPEMAEGETEEHETNFKGPYGGLFSAESKSGSVAIDGATNEGVYLEGKAKPACYFSGYAVSD